MSIFKKAKPTMGLPRCMWIGPTFSGKSCWAIETALGLANKVAVIDADQGTSQMYVGKKFWGGEYQFDMVSVESMGVGKDVGTPDDDNLYHPNRFVKAIHAARKEGYGAIVVDDASKEWSGQGGCLEIKDRAEASVKNSGWRTVTPLHDKFIRAMMTYPGVVIATFRGKDKLKIVEMPDGKTKYEELPGEPIARPGTKFEFKMVGFVWADHKLELIKVKGKGGEGLLGLYEDSEQLVKEVQRYFGLKGKL